VRRRLRDMTEVHAHQRKIAEKQRAENPRPRLTAPLSQFKVQTITREVAKPFIEEHEYLGTISNSAYFIGLFSPDRELVGVACFGYGPADETMRTLLGGPALCLERGACVAHAPENAASYLINHACHLVCRIRGVSRFFAYSDPSAGEYGGVYQACNWLYLGQGINGEKDRQWRTHVLPPGLDPDNPANWKTTRILRSKKYKRLTEAEALERGWQIARCPAKHVYAINVGRGKRTWRKTMVAKPYPAPRPELKEFWEKWEAVYLMKWSPDKDEALRAAKKSRQMLEARYMTMSDVPEFLKKKFKALELPRYIHGVPWREFGR
jgi:hypothetical protein